MQIIGFWRLKAGGVLAKSRIVHDVAEGITPYFTLANPCVTVYPRPKVSLRIVKMKGYDLLDSDQGIHLPDG